MKILPFSVLSASGKPFRVMLPLHPQTVSPELVGDLATRLLNTISDAVAERPGVSAGDVLQAVALTLAVRSQVIQAPPQAAARVAEQLVATALNAVEESQTVDSGRS